MTFIVFDQIQNMYEEIYITVYMNYLAFDLRWQQNYNNIHSRYLSGM